MKAFVATEDVRVLRAVGVALKDEKLVALCDLALDLENDSPEGYAAQEECERLVRAARCAS